MRIPGSKTTHQYSVTSSAAVQIASASTNRRVIVITNLGPNTVYLDNANTVASASGFPLASGASLTDYMSTDDWYAKCASTETADIRTLEFV